VIDRSMNCAYPAVAAVDLGDRDAHREAAGDLRLFAVGVDLGLELLRLARRKIVASTQKLRRSGGGWKNLRSRGKRGSRNLKQASGAQFSRAAQT
jgi:hypothetical protein